MLAAAAHASHMRLAQLRSIWGQLDNVDNTPSERRAAYTVSYHLLLTCRCSSSSSMSVPASAHSCGSGPAQ